MKDFGIIAGGMFFVTFLIAVNTNINLAVLLILYIFAVLALAVLLSIREFRQFNDPNTGCKVSLARVVNKNTKTGLEMVKYVLRVTGRTSGNRHVLKLAENINHNYTYHPEQTVFTGATVGGITTGGFHTIEAHHTDSISKSGKYRLMCTLVCLEAALATPPENAPYEISEIELATNELVESAKNHPVVSKFLKGNRLLLKRYPADMMEKLAGAGGTGDQTLMMNMFARVSASIGLTKEEGNAVLNWLTGA